MAHTFTVLSWQLGHRSREGGIVGRAQATRRIPTADGLEAHGAVAVWVVVILAHGHVVERR